MTTTRPENTRPENTTPDTVPISTRTASLTAGIGLAVMTVLAPLGLMIALPAGLTGVAALTVLAVAGLDVVVGISLRPVLAHAGELLARTASTLRIVYAAVFATAAGSLVGPSPEAAQFQAIWDMGLVIFAAHLVLVGVALVRGRGLPSWLGVLVLVAGLGYLADGITVALLATAGMVGQFTFVGEIALCIWLLGWSGRQASVQPPLQSGSRLRP